MLVWIILFGLVVAVSFFLALHSMRNFMETPKISDFGVFLVRKTGNITSQFLDEINLQIIKDGSIVSFERLFKGNQSTLVIFALRSLTQKFIDTLDLLELEDYTKSDIVNFTAFEMGTKRKKEEKVFHNFFREFPSLGENETIWWQIVLKPGSNLTYECLPRVVVTCETHSRVIQIGKQLESLSEGFLVKIPKPYTKEQIIKFYRERNFSKSEHNLNLSSNKLLDLIVIKKT